jgi:hypothetical protein
MRCNASEPVNTLREAILLVFLPASAAYVFFRSDHWIGDGIRNIPAAFSGTHPFGTLNHLLFPTWTLTVRAVLDGFGMLSIVPQEAHIQLIRAIQACNGVFAAIALSVLYVVLRRVGVRRSIALGSVTFVGLSHAFVLHATDMTEPMPSVLLALLGVLLAQQKEAWLPRLGAGVLLGIASAFYLIAIGAGLLILALAIRERSLRSITATALTVGIGAFLAFLAIVLIGSVAVRHGFDDSIRSSFVGNPGGLFGSFSPRHLVGAAFGSANAFAPLVDYSGVSGLLKQPAAALLHNLLVFAVSWFGLGIIAWRACHVPFYPPLVAAVSWWVATFLLAAYWSPTYEKLWLYGVIALSVFCALVLEHDRTYWARPRGREPFLWFAAALALFSVAYGVIPRRFSPNPDVVLAKQIVARIGSNDLLVAPGWDGPSVVASTVLDFSLNRFSLVDEALVHGLDREQVLVALERRAADSLEHGGKVCFLGLLALSEQEWALFFGSRLKLPHGMLDSWKRATAAPELLAAGDRTVELACVGRPEFGAAAAKRKEPPGR